MSRLVVSCASCERWLGVTVRSVSVEAATVEVPGFLETFDELGHDSCCQRRPVDRAVMLLLRQPTRVYVGSSL